MKEKNCSGLSDFNIYKKKYGLEGMFVLKNVEVLMSKYSWALKYVFRFEALLAHCRSYCTVKVLKNVSCCSFHYFIDKRDFVVWPRFI